MPFALVGGIWPGGGWLQHVGGCRVGFIALAGVAAETGVIMLIYLDHAWEGNSLARCRSENKEPGVATCTRDHGRRSRTGPPQDDDRGAIMAGLLPILWGLAQAGS